jgi:hypothetical protein
MTGFTDHMTFMERAHNSALKIAQKIFFLYSNTLLDGFIQKHLPTSPGSTELLGDLSGCLILANSVIDYPILKPESFVNIGGLSIQKKTELIKDQVLHTFSCIFVCSFFNVSISYYRM